MTEHLRKSYRHVWRLPEGVSGDIQNRLPTHAWVAFGPRGEMAGVESSEAQAASRAYLAEHLLAETVEGWPR